MAIQSKGTAKVAVAAGGRQENLDYVRDMLMQLKVVSGARSGSLFTLLMEMAILEIDGEIGSGGKPNHDDSKQ